MALDGMIFDIDGTLIDTNPSHVEAWRLAFESLGYRVSADRIEREVGKGGDLLVPSILGDEAEERDGPALRDAQKREFLAIAARTRFRVFPRVPELFRALADRGIRTVLATSSNEQHLQGTFASAGIDLPGLADAMVTKDDAEASKPEPDLVLAAVRALGATPWQCAMVGDTAFDAQASGGAGVVCLGVLSGGKQPDELMAAGARAVWRDTGHLFDDLDAALAMASPGTGRLDPGAVECLMREALGVAREGMSRGEVPIGCLIARRDGTILARAYNELKRSRDRTAHAELVAFRRAAGRIDGADEGLVLVSTLEPCVMCTGAAMQVGIDTILYALPAPPDSGTARVVPPRSPDARMPRVVGGILADESRGLLQEWLRTDGNEEQRGYVELLLKEA